MARYVHVTLLLPPQRYKLLPYATLVQDSMTGNVRFPDATSLLGTLGPTIKALDKAETAAMRRTTGTVTAREAAREQVKEVLWHLCDHVQGVVETLLDTPDLLAIEATVESAAMGLRKIGVRPKAVFAAKHGPFAGSVDLTAPANLKGDPYEWEHSGNQMEWTSLPVTRQARTLVMGLPIGEVRYFRYRRLTRTGPTAWSDPILTVVT